MTQPETPTSALNQRYLGYFGRYTVDAVNGSVVHHVVGSSFGPFIGTDLTRFYRFAATESLS